MHVITFGCDDSGRSFCKATNRVPSRLCFVCPSLRSVWHRNYGCSSIRQGLFQWPRSTELARRVEVGRGIGLCFSGWWIRADGLPSMILFLLVPESWCGGSFSRCAFRSSGQFPKYEIPVCRSRKYFDKISIHIHCIGKSRRIYRVVRRVAQSGHR